MLFRCEVCSNYSLASWNEVLQAVKFRTVWEALLVRELPHWRAAEERAAVFQELVLDSYKGILKPNKCHLPHLPPLCQTENPKANHLLTNKPPKFKKEVIIKPGLLLIFRCEKEHSSFISWNGIFPVACFFQETCFLTVSFSWQQHPWQFPVILCWWRLQEALSQAANTVRTSSKLRAESWTRWPLKVSSTPNHSTSPWCSGSVRCVTLA